MQMKLFQILEESIKKRGRLTYPEFLEVVLFHPEYGYYNKKSEIIGKEGDYYTSSDLHPLFGWTLAHVIMKSWEGDGRPGDPCILEPGAGKGYLAHDILQWLEKSPTLFSVLKYLILEKSEAMRKKERGVLKTYQDRVAWIRSEEGDLPCRWVFLLSNEFFDVFPFHRVKRRKEGFTELFVGLKGDSLVEIEGRLSSEALREFLERYLPYREEGEILEVMPGIQEVIRRMSSWILRGYFLTFDYGYERKELRTRFPRGSLKTYHRHQVGEDPFLHLGDQDITAHVDFTLLEELLREEGFEILFSGLQGPFLVDSGIADLLDEYSRFAPEKDLLKARLALKNLVYDFGSIFRVIFARGK